VNRLQVYVDHQNRDQPPQGVGLELTTYDVEFQQALRAGGRHSIVWGVGQRFNDYEVGNTPTLAIQPAARVLSLTNVFAQDTMALGERLNLTAGVKFERNSFSGWSTLPDLRLAWTPDDRTVIWTKAARAIRSPTPFDVEVVERIDGVNPFLEGNPDFRTEKVDAYEVGYRSQPHASASWSLSAFYNEYDDLRSIELSPDTGFLPLRWGNGMEGHTYGVDFWAEWQATSWWRVSPGFRWLRKDLRFSAGSSGLGGLAQAGNDPRARGSLKSSMAWRRLSFDAMLRYVDELPEPANPDYYELNARLGWKLSEALELSVSGFNLLESTHYEYPAPTGQAIRRSVQADIRWNF
jgi:iron complex outermembrane receptor protein